MKQNLMLSTICGCLSLFAMAPAWAAKPMAAYLVTLELYTEGRYHEASTALLKLRPPASIRQDDAVFARLREASLRLAAEDPEALVPIAGLFSKAHARLLAVEATRAALIVQRTLEELLESYVDLSTSPDARRVASRLLTHVAIDIRDLLQAFDAIETLELALEHDPDNVAALQALAALAEKDGDLVEATRRLEQLLLVDPESVTARLRLGVVERKLGNVETAFAELRRVIDQHREPWLAIVAYQEIAKGRLALNETEQAIQVLEEALERFPDQERLRLQLAFLRGERFASPSSLLAGLTSQPWRAEVTPRALYNNWPDDEVIAVRTQVAADIEARFDNLRKALYAW